jgi:quercetin dioxygenase-like cupin family protein
MEVIRGGERTDLYGGRFTGAVELEMLHEALSDQDPDTALVHFHEGALSYWHSHPGGQLLYVVGGRARVGTEESGSIDLEPGNLVVTPPDELHWHGAAEGDATLLAVTWGTTDWQDRAP